MKRSNLFLTAAMLFASNAFAGSFNCGVFLDQDEQPAATFSFEPTAGNRVSVQAGKFVGFVQSNDSVDAENQPLLVIGTAAADKTVAAAAYPTNAPFMLSLLQTSMGPKAMTICESSGKKLSRPAGL